MDIGEEQERIVVEPMHPPVPERAPTPDPERIPEPAPTPGPERVPEPAPTPEPEPIPA